MSDRPIFEPCSLQASKSNMNDVESKVFADNVAEAHELLAIRRYEVGTTTVSSGIIHLIDEMLLWQK